MFTFNIEPALTLVEKPSLSQLVIAAAKSIIGQKEKPGNSGFTDPLFEARMKSVGWKDGEAWCTYTGELIWKQAITPDHSLYSELNKCFDGSAVKTWQNFKRSKSFKTGSLPKEGALAIFQLGRGWQGHLTVVIELKDAGRFQTVEGNTNGSGGREGIEVAQKIRVTVAPFKSNGLNLLGFVYLPE